MTYEVLDSYSWLQENSLLANQKLLASSGAKESSKILCYGFKGQLEQKDRYVAPNTKNSSIQAKELL